MVGCRPAAPGESLLFVGCRDPERDRLHADELAGYGKSGVVTVRTVFSGRPEDGRRYVQHELAHRGDEVWGLVERGAHVYVCGNANTIAPRGAGRAHRPLVWTRGRLGGGCGAVAGGPAGLGPVRGGRLGRLSRVGSTGAARTGMLITVAGVAMVFSGGGAPAAYFGAGVVRAVEEAGLQPRIFSGVSAGAVNAAALAVGFDAAALGAMWREIRWSDIARLRTDVYRLPKVGNMVRGAPHLLDWALGSVGWNALLDSSPARATLQKRLGGPPLRVADGRTLLVSAVDVSTGEVLRFANRAAPRPGSAVRPGPITVEHLLASAAVPVMFPPVEIDGRLLVDAGTVANTPLAPVMAFEPDAVVVVSGSGGTRPAPPPASLGETIGLLVDNLAHFALEADVEHTRTVNELARAGATDRKEVSLVLVEPRRLAFSAGAFFKFTAAEADRIMGYGHERGVEALAAWQEAADGPVRAF